MLQGINIAININIALYYIGINVGINVAVDYKAANKYLA